MTATLGTEPPPDLGERRLDLLTLLGDLVVGEVRSGARNSSLRASDLLPLPHLLAAIHVEDADATEQLAAAAPDRLLHLGRPVSSPTTTAMSWSTAGKVVTSR